MKSFLFRWVPLFAAAAIFLVCAATFAAWAEEVAVAPATDTNSAAVQEEPHSFWRDSQKEATYVGAEKCKMCHSAQYKTWAQTKMGNHAWELIKDQPDKQLCYPCHTTGYGRGGFVSAEDTPNLVNVQCEACHGPGSAHVAAPMRDKAKKHETITREVRSCAGCHNPHVLNKAEAARGGATPPAEQPAEQPAK